MLYYIILLLHNRMASVKCNTFRPLRIISRKNILLKTYVAVYVDVLKFVRSQI